MKNIKIVFGKSKGFFPWLIRWLTDSSVNHVAITYESTDWENTWVAEAEPKGVYTTPQNNRTWLFSFDIKYDIANSVKFAQQYFGEHYDYPSFFAFGWILLCWKLLKINIRRPWRSASGQFCSEFVARILQPKYPEIDNPQWVTPQDLLAICRRHTDNFIEIK